jgi:hypothetical protein
MAKQLWFGNPKTKMQFVPAPLAGAESSKVRFADSMQFENGGADVQRSAGYHMQYQFNYNTALGDSEDLNVFNKFASGFYGKGLVYFADPYTFTTNVLPACWATPALSEEGWPTLGATPTYGTLQLPIIATNLATNPSFETGSGTVEVRRNLIGNPAAVSTTGYSGTNGTLSAITDFPTFGNAVRHERTSAGATARLTAAIGAGFLPSTEYTTVFQVRASESLSSVTVEYRHSATVSGVVVWTGTIPSGVSEVRVTGTRSATTAVAGAGPTFLWSSGALNSTLDVTRVQTELGPTAGDYFDGGTLPAGDFTYAWVGTANASQSIQNGVGVTTVSAGGVNIAAWQGTTWSSTGTKSLRMRPVAAVNTNVFAVISPGFTIGQEYTVLAKVRLTAPLLNENVNGRKIRIHASGGGLIAESSQAPNTAGVHELSVTFTATQTANVIRLTHFGVVGDGDLWWDDLLLIEGTYTGTYFDGSTPSTISNAYSWTGAPNASTSVLALPASLTGQPARTATYLVNWAPGSAPTGPNGKIFIPIPPDSTLHLGVSGIAGIGTAVVQVRPVVGPNFYGATTNLSLLDPNGPTRMNASFSGANCQGVEIYITRTSVAMSSITLSSIMGRIYKTGVTPVLTGEHYQGEGHSGLEFADNAIVETYQYINPPRKALSTTLVEVGAWRQNV